LNVTNGFISTKNKQMSRLLTWEKNPFTPAGYVRKSSHGASNSGIQSWSAGTSEKGQLTLERKIALASSKQEFKSVY